MILGLILWFMTEQPLILSDEINLRTSGRDSQIVKQGYQGSHSYGELPVESLKKSEVKRGSTR